jgi:hypothetical protein
MTEYRWSPGVFNSAIGTADRAARLLGVPRLTWRPQWSNEALGYQATSVAPYTQRYNAKMGLLRLAIQDSAIPNRQMKGRPGDGGASLWPVYMDLLLAMTRRAQWPMAGAIDPAVAPDFRSVPPMSFEVASRMFGAPPWEAPPVVLAYDRAVKNKIATRGREGPGRMGIGVDAEAAKNELVALTGFGRGDWASAVSGIFTMIDRWGSSVRPVYQQDQKALAAKLADALPQVETIARQRLAAWGLTQEARPSLRRSMSKLVGLGLVSEQQAIKASAANNAGMAAASALALAGLGWYFLP